MTTATRPPPPADRIAGRPVWRDLLELLASMRFAIALLTLICIASIIGTVVKQHEPFNNYVNQFGPFWAQVFDHVGLYALYSAGWFLLILAFLVTSTSLCIARNTPKIIADFKTYKENVREQALRAFHHKAEGRLAMDGDAALAHVNAVLAEGRWSARAQVRENGTMVAARAGMANKIGYLCAHSSIVLICLGGLLDGDLIVKAQMALQGKTPFNGGGLITDVAPEHRLTATNPTFRGNLLVTEGGRAGVAVLNMPDGVVLQDLPFEVELKKFRVEYYDTGMPKLFASDVVVHDRATGRQTEATIEVNEPLIIDGIAIYQSSFDDGGSQLKLRGLPLQSGRSFEVDGRVGDNTLLTKSGNAALTLEISGLRVINVENLGGAAGGSASGTDVRGVDLGQRLTDHLGTTSLLSRDKHLRNVGPSFSYRLRDASGQAREYNNYMASVDLDGQRVVLAGVRESVNEPFRYLRIPVDDDFRVDTWWRALQALRDPARRAAAAQAYVAKATPADNPRMGEQLLMTTQRALDLFAGAAPVPAAPAGAAPGADSPQAMDAELAGGLPSLGRFVEVTVPAGERERISDVLLRILNGGLFELVNQVRADAGKPPMAIDDDSQKFMTQMVLALSDAAYYPAPVMFQLDSFEQRQASVFQVTRAPGKKLVYLGAVLLTIGIFAMLYIRERRLWIWLQPDPAGGTRLTTALSTTRRTLDTDTDFERLKTRLLADDGAPALKDSAA